LTVISPACACRLPTVGALIAACCVAAGVGAAAPAPAQSDTGAMRVPTVTRLVQMFSELEGRLDAAAREHDAAAFDRLLHADFELRNAARPGTPLPRAEFVQQTLDRPMAPARIEQMAVHDIAAAIVSFLRRSTDAAATLFVVDVWGRTGDDWRLQVRYAGPGGAQAAQSGAPMPRSGEDLPKKY
jgi:hypothetical protein